MKDQEEETEDLITEASSSEEEEDEESGTEEKKEKRLTKLHPKRTKTQIDNWDQEYISIKMGTNKIKIFFTNINGLYSSWKSRKLLHN